MTGPIRGLSDVSGSVWLATAVLTYQRAFDLTRKNAPYPEVDFAFGQGTIRERADRVCSKRVHAARISQWTNADHPNSTYNYLRSVGSKRRLTLPGECNGRKESPLDLCPQDALVLDDAERGVTLTFGEVMRWVRSEYPAYLIPRPKQEERILDRERQGRPQHQDVTPANQAAIEELGRGGAGRVLVLRAGRAELRFHQVNILFEKGEEVDVFRHKGNKTLGETLGHPRYSHLRREVEGRFSEKLNMPLGEFLYELKQRDEPFYREFLNPHGDLTYSRFSIVDPEWPGEKGLYIYELAGQVMYVGRCLDTFAKRINQGYGRIHPKNCFLDGQSTNCRLNSLVTKHRRGIRLYLCRMEATSDIASSEQTMITAYDPPWNRQKAVS